MKEGGSDSTVSRHERSDAEMGRDGMDGCSGEVIVLRNERVMGTVSDRNSGCVSERRLGYKEGRTSRSRCYAWRSLVARCVIALSAVAD